jgi:hypothetical protein
MARPESSRDVSEGSELAGRTWIRALGWLGFLAAALAGAYARFDGLGSRPLAVDEYYLLSSVQAILEHRVPILPGGGYYTRGILVQYLTVLPLRLFEDTELALRLPSVLFGLGTVGLAYLYGRRVLGPRPALLLAALLLVSSWEIEFSRFGRMYAAFQFFTVAFIIALAAAVRDARGWRFIAPMALLAAAMLSHDLAVVLVPLVFLPLILPEWSQRFRTTVRAAAYGLVSAITSVLLLSYWRTDFRLMGVENRFPANYGPATGSSPIDLPSYPFWSVADDPLLNVLLSGLFILVVSGSAALVGRRRGGGVGVHVVAAAFVTSAILHALMLTVLCGALLLGWYRYDRSRSPDPWITRAAIVGSALALGWVVWAGWLTYGLGDRSWIAATGEPVFSGALFEAFFWPDPYPVFVQPWTQDLPLLGVSILAAVVLQILTKLRRPPAELVMNPGFILLYFVLVLGVPDPLFHTTRYSFFLYPFALATLVLSIVELAGRLGRYWSPLQRIGPLPAATVTVALLFVMSSDFNHRHLVQAASPEVTFRRGDFERFNDIWYPRWDFATPATLLGSRARADEPVIVADLPPVSAYLERSHAVYLPRGSHRFDNVSRTSGTVDFWSGRPLLSTPLEVCQYSGDAKVVWIAWPGRQTGSPTAGSLDPLDIWGDRFVVSTVEYGSPDGRIEVVRVELTPGPEPGCPI